MARSSHFGWIIRLLSNVLGLGMLQKSYRSCHLHHVSEARSLRSSEITLTDLCFQYPFVDWVKYQ